jgi:alpha-L-rhamnosidase
VVCAGPGLVAAGPPAPTALQCEYQRNPLGLDATPPRLGWQFNANQRGARQSAYQVRVAASPEQLQHGESLLWDSGKVISDRSARVPYDGKALSSGQRCYWQVRTWNQADEPSPWSAVAHWEMGLLRPSAWEAQWITSEAIEKTFAQPQPLAHPRFNRRCIKRRPHLFSRHVHDRGATVAASP